jgi:uncharacterized protein (DUF1778 family)
MKTKVRAKADATGARTKSKRAKAPARTKPMLSFRMDEETRDLVDRAAAAAGQNRTDFMITALRERAVEVLLAQRLFALNDADWAAFVERLDDPPPPNAKLKALLARTPIWDRQ